MSWLTWVPRILWFVLWLGKEIASCSWSVIHDNVTPGQDSTVGIARIATQCRTEFEVMLLGSIITLTPGTLTVGSVSDEVNGQTKYALYVHSMYSETQDELRQEIADMEQHMLAAVRREGVAA